MHGWMDDLRTVFQPYPVNAGDNERQCAWEFTVKKLLKHTYFLALLLYMPFNLRTKMQGTKNV